MNPGPQVTTEPEVAASRGSSNLTRRRFVQRSVAAGAGLYVAPRTTLRARPSKQDTLDVAHIGVGGMGWSDVRGIAETGQNIYALCDVDERRAERAFRTFPDALRFRDFRHMLEQEGDRIDAVVVSTPDHTHAAAAMMALSMGIPCRVQKPLARTLGEVREIVRAAREAGVATQMGNQGHAMEGTRQIREWVEAGAIGDVREVQYWTNRPIWAQALDRPTEAHHVPGWLDWDLWLGPAAERPYNPAYAPFSWRGWWDFGTGALGDIACHSMDAAFWTLDLGLPERIVPETTRLYEETAPAVSRIDYRFPARGDRGPIRVVWRDGNLQPPRPPEVPDEANWPPSADGGQLWIGTDGKLVAGIYGEDPRLLDDARDAEIRADPPDETYPRTEGVYAEFVAACQGGPAAGSSFVEHAGPLTEMVLIGNLAVRSGRELRLDPETGDVLNDVDIPEEFIRPTYRSGWGW